MLQIQLIATLTGHKDCIYTLAKKDPSTFFSAGADGYIIEWNTKNINIGTLIARAKETIYTICYVEEHNTLLIGQNYEGIQWINTKLKKVSQTLKLKPTSIFDIQYYDHKLYVGDGEGRLYIIDFYKAKILSILEYSNKSIRTITINPKKQEIIAGYSDSTIRLFNLNNLKLIKTLHQHSNSIFTTAIYSSDLLLSSGRDKTICVWNAKSDYSLIECKESHKSTINSIGILKERNCFITASRDRELKLWKIEDGTMKNISTLEPLTHKNSVNKVICLTEDLIASGSDDNTIKIWKLKELKK